MQIPKPSDEGKDLFRAVVPAAPGVEVKPMFGNLGAFVNGNMFAGLLGVVIGVRMLDEASLAELTSIDGTGDFGPAERPMGGYVALPRAWHSEPDRLTAWVTVALEQVGQLPVKQPKTRKKS